MWNSFNICLAFSGDIIMWLIFVCVWCSKPVAHLYGQGSPVFGIQLDNQEEKIYSIGNDNTIKVWEWQHYKGMGMTTL